MRRIRTLAVTAVVVGAVGLVPLAANAEDTSWVVEKKIAGGVVDSELAEDQPGNDCEDYINIPFGTAPGWARVGGDPNPHAPIIEISGQILDPHAYVAFSDDDKQDRSLKTNAFVTHTDAHFNHFARDINVFITPDPEDRRYMAHGNFVEGDRNEHGHMEIEWERGGIPMFAFPALGDRLTVWGPHIFDCGHGDTWVELPGDDDTYRTEIHPPLGWVMFRKAADADGVPQNGKQDQTPWKWFEPTDGQGAGGIFPASGLLGSTVQASIADAYFTSYGGNAIEALNGCDDGDDPALTCYDYSERPELSKNEDIDSWEWASPVLDHDYTFIVPAPPKPLAAFADVELAWDVQGRCSEVPADPTIPNKHDHPEAAEDEVEGAESSGTIYASDRPIGGARCNHAPGGAKPYTVEADPTGEASWNLSAQPAIRVTVRAKTGADGIDGTADDPTYPANDYISFAYRVAVGWDHAPPAAERPRTYRVDFDTLRVYDDGEPCGDDGEWIMSLRANDQYIHPVEGTTPDDNDSNDRTEPLWEDEAIDDDKCSADPTYDPTYKSYEMGTDGAQYLTRYVTALPGEKIEIWERAYDKDGLSNDDLSPVIREFLTPPGPGGTQTYVVGNGDHDVEMSHTIVLNITDVTRAVPSPAPLSFGTPRYGPNADTSGLFRVSGATPATVTATAGVDGLEYRIWDQASTPGSWSFDLDASNGLAIDLPDVGSCTCVIEWATIDGVGDDAVVSQRQRMTVQLDNTPPTLTVPPDRTVYANQTAGARVEYTVSATDNFPGPINVACTPGSGTIFPNGSNQPLVTTVNCSATDTVQNVATDAFDVTVVSPVGYVNDYALLGVQWLDVRRDARVQDGNVGVFDRSAGLPSTPGLELLIGRDGVLPAAGLVAAHTVALEARVSAGEILAVDGLTAGAGSTYSPRTACDPLANATLVRCAYVPLWPSLPVFLPAAPGVLPITASGLVNPIAPGAYSEMRLMPKSVATLAPGDYSFSSIEMMPGSRLEFTGPTTLRIASRLIVRQATIVPIGIALPTNLIAYVGGQDVAPNKWPLDVKPGSVIRANAYVLEGTAEIGNGALIEGAVLAKRLLLGSNVTVRKASGFFLP